MYLSWIIPAYNEEKRIEKTILEVDEYLKHKNFNGGYEIIVSNSASKDKTAEIVENLRKSIPHLRLITMENKGKGWAVRKGMLEAKGQIRLFSDADNSTSPNNFDTMEPLFEKGYDVVISSRHPRDVAGASRDVKEPILREIMGGMGNLLIQIFGVWGIWDTQNGFKALQAEVAEKIFHALTMKGFSFDIEMLALARRFKYKIGIIPIHWRFDANSTVTPSAYIKVFLDVFKIRWNLISGKYK